MRRTGAANRGGGCTAEKGNREEEVEGESRKGGRQEKDVCVLYVPSVFWCVSLSLSLLLALCIGLW